MVEFFEYSQFCILSIPSKWRRCASCDKHSRAGGRQKIWRLVSASELHMLPCPRPRQFFLSLPCLLSTSVSRCVSSRVFLYLLAQSSIQANSNAATFFHDSIPCFLPDLLRYFSMSPALLDCRVARPRLGTVDARRHAPSSSASARACSRPKVRLLNVSRREFAPL